MRQLLRLDGTKDKRNKTGSEINWPDKNVGGKMRQWVRIDVMRDKWNKRLSLFNGRLKMRQLVRIDAMRDKWNKRWSEINWPAQNCGGAKMRQLV